MNLANLAAKFATGNPSGRSPSTRAHAARLLGNGDRAVSDRLVAQ